MKANLTYGLLGVILVASALVCVHFYTRANVNNALEKATLAVTAKIAAQELIVATIADLTRQNNADEITEQIVVDCTPLERQRFDSLLDKLSVAIDYTELRELDGLFYKCGRFYADRKAVMAGRLTREVAVYRDYINLQDQVSQIDQALVERAVLWEQVATKEMDLAAEFAKLVDLQREIIMTLQAGKDRNAPEIIATLKTVSDVKANMTVLLKQIENTRAELQKI